MPTRAALQEANISRFTLPKAKALPQKGDLDLAALPLYCGSLGLELRHLSVDQIGMVLAAKNLEPLICALKDTPLADARNLERESNLTAEDADQTADERSTKDLLELGVLPARDFSIETATSVYDLPDILPSQLGGMRGKQLLAQLRMGKLMKRVWREDSDTEDSGDQVGLDKYYSLQQKEVDQTTFRGTVLLDITQSMGNLDRRGVVARGAALVFLKRVLHYGGELHCAPFLTDIVGLRSGHGEEGLRDLASYIIMLKNKGATNIQRSLNSAQELVFSKADFEHDDLFLVSDGLSKLTTPPSESIRLHTLLLGDVINRDEGQTTQIGWQEQLETLQSWSRSFTKMSDLKEILHLDGEDVEAIIQLLNEAEVDLEGSLSLQERVELMALIDSLHDALKEYAPVEDIYRERAESAATHAAQLLEMGGGDKNSKALSRIRKELCKSASGSAASSCDPESEMSAGGGGNGKVTKDDVEQFHAQLFGGNHGSTSINPFRIIKALCRRLVSGVVSGAKIVYQGITRKN